MSFRLFCLNLRTVGLRENKAITQQALSIPDDPFTQEGFAKELSMGIPAQSQLIIDDPILKKNAEGANLDETALSKIIKGRIEADRKQLILIWMLYEAVDSDTSGLSEERVLKELRKNVIRINKDILEPCGMPRLDARNPFDWIILNAMSHSCGSDDGMDAKERLCALIDVLFAGAVKKG